MLFIFLRFSLLQKQGEVKPFVQRQMVILTGGTEVTQKLSRGSQSESVHVRPLPLIVLSQQPLIRGSLKKFGLNYAPHILVP